MKILFTFLVLCVMMGVSVVVTSKMDFTLVQVALISVVESSCVLLVVCGMMEHIERKMDKCLQTQTQNG